MVENRWLERFCVKSDKVGELEKGYVGRSGPSDEGMVKLAGGGGDCGKVGKPVGRGEKI